MKNVAYDAITAPNSAITATPVRRQSETVHLRQAVLRTRRLRNNQHLSAVLQMRRREEEFVEIYPFSRAPHMPVLLSKALFRYLEVHPVTRSHWYRDDSSLILANRSVESLRIELTGYRGSKEIFWRAFTLEDGARIERCLGGWFQKSPDRIIISPV
jgi:hypothetical protein